MKKIFLTIALIFALPFVFQNNYSVLAQTCIGTYESNTVNVTLNNAASLPAILAQYNLQVIETLPATATYYFRIQDGVSPCTKATQLRADVRVLLASPNYYIDTFEGSGIIHWAGGPQRFKSSEDSYENQWAISKIKLREAQKITTGAGMIVAVFDTGIDKTHPLFDPIKHPGRVLQGYDFVSNDNDPSEVYIEGSKAYGHGTHVAGIISLVAPDAIILPVRVLDGNGIGTDWNLVKALRYVAAFRDQNRPVQVMNMSFSTPDRSDVAESVLHDAVKGRVDGTELELRRRIVVVAAAGNNSSSLPYFPAMESVCEQDEILSVAASMPNDLLAYFSNYSSPQRCEPGDPLLSWVNVMAPGHRIISSMPDARYGTWSGTSMASPFVAGLAALVRAKNPNIKAEGIGCQITTTSDPMTTPNALPRINALTAVSNLLPQCNEPVRPVSVRTQK